MKCFKAIVLLLACSILVPAASFGLSKPTESITVFYSNPSNNQCRTVGAANLAPTGTITVVSNGGAFDGSKAKFCALKSDAEIVGEADGWEVVGGAGVPKEFTRDARAFVSDDRKSVIVNTEIPRGRGQIILIR